MFPVAEHRGPDTPVSDAEREHPLIELAGPAIGRSAARLAMAVRPATLGALRRGIVDGGTSMATSAAGQDQPSAERHA